MEDGEEPDIEAGHTGTDGEKRNAPAGDARPQAPTTLDDPTDPQLHKDTAAQRTPAATASGSPPRDNNRQQTSDTRNNAQTPRAAAAACTKSLLNTPDGPTADPGPAMETPLIRRKPSNQAPTITPTAPPARHCSSGICPLRATTTRPLASTHQACPRCNLPSWCTTACRETTGQEQGGAAATLCAACFQAGPEAQARLVSNEVPYIKEACPAQPTIEDRPSQHAVRQQAPSAVEQAAAAAFN